jgi:phage protein D
MEKVSSPSFEVLYAGKDITTDISAHLISVSYSDRTEGESDEVEIVVEDTDGKWMNEWYPEKGDRINLSVGYDGNMLDCGEFTIDELELDGPPRTLTIRALAAGINSPLRSKRSSAHESQSLRQIAEAVAARQGLTIEDGTASTSRVRVDYSAERAELSKAAADARAALQANILERYKNVVREHYAALLLAADSLTTKTRGEDAAEIRQTVALWQAAWLYNQLPDIQKTRQTISNFAARLDAIAASLKDIDQTITRSKLDIQVARATQDRETDLEFLRKLAARYGILFSVRGTVLVFTSMYDIEGAGPVATLGPSEITRYSMKDKATKTYTRARVSYHDPVRRKEVVAEVEASDLPASGELVTVDVLLLSDRVEDDAQAQEVAKAALYRVNSKTAEADIELPGRPMLVAGINLVLTNMGVMSGTWHVLESQHRIDKSSGYVTAVKLKRVKKS